MRDSNPQAVSRASFQDWCNSHSANPPEGSRKLSGLRPAINGAPHALVFVPPQHSSNMFASPAANGILTRSGDSAGYLVTVDKYRNFELALDWRTSNEATAESSIVAPRTMARSSVSSGDTDSRQRAASQRKVGRHIRPHEPAQCRNCRWPVNTIAIPCSFAAAMTSSSFTDPPGWMIAVIPASAA